VADARLVAGAANGLPWALAGDYADVGTAVDRLELQASRVVGQPVALFDSPGVAAPSVEDDLTGALSQLTIGLTILSADSALRAGVDREDFRSSVTTLERTADAIEASGAEPVRLGVRRAARDLRRGRRRPDAAQRPTRPDRRDLAVQGPQRHPCPVRPGRLDPPLAVAHYSYDSLPAGERSGLPTADELAAALDKPATPATPAIPDRADDDWQSQPQAALDRRTRRAGDVRIERGGGATQRPSGSRSP